MSRISSAYGRRNKSIDNGQKGDYFDGFYPSSSFISFVNFICNILYLNYCKIKNQFKQFFKCWFYVKENYFFQYHQKLIERFIGSNINPLLINAIIDKIFLGLMWLIRLLYIIGSCGKS